MIPKAGPKAQTFPPMKLYREDLEKLLSMFKKHCKTVTIADEENVYESLDEISKNSPPRLHSLHITGQMPHAELIIKGSRSVQLPVQRSTLWIMQPTDDAKLVFLTAKEFLLKRRWTLRIILVWVAVVVGIIVLLGGTFLKPFLRGRYPYGEMFAEIISIIALSLFIYGAYFHSQQVSFVTLKLRAHTDSFWQRNRDKILLVLVTVGITELVHWIVTYLTK